MLLFNLLTTNKDLEPPAFLQNNFGQYVGESSHQDFAPHDSSQYRLPPVNSPSSHGHHTPSGSRATIRRTAGDEITMRALAQVSTISPSVHHVIDFNEQHSVSSRTRPVQPESQSTGVLDKHWSNNGPPKPPNADLLRAYSQPPRTPTSTTSNSTNYQYTASPAVSSATSLSSAKSTHLKSNTRAARNSKVGPDHKPKPSQLRFYDKSHQEKLTSAKRLYKVGLWNVNAFPNAASKASMAREAFSETTSGTQGQ